VTSQPEPVPPPAGVLPAGLSPNGHTPTARLMEALPEMLFSAAAAALRQQPLTVRPLPCGVCVLERLKWGHAHAAEIAAAEQEFQAAQAEMAQKAPEDQVPLNGMEYLPPRLHPGAPQGPPDIREPVTMWGGTLVCTEHIPGAPGQPGQRPFLIAQGALSASMLAEIRGNAA
jgi:hypothetical protein